MTAIGCASRRKPWKNRPSARAPSCGGHAVVEIGLLRLGRQLAVEQQVAGLEEVAVLGELLDRIAAVEQDALVAVDVGDLGLAAAGRGEAGS
jgi:predicted RNase H-like nuclease